MATLLDFTNRALDALKPPATGRQEFKDTKAPGLYIRVTAGGVKTFSFVGRPKGSSRVERITLGRYPIVKADEARRQATMLAGDLAAGKSPSTTSRLNRAELTVAQAFERYFEVKRLRGRKSVANEESVFCMHIEPAFGSRRMSEVTSSAVERWHLSIPAKVLQRRQERHAAALARTNAEAERRMISRAQRRRGPDPKPDVDASVTPAYTTTGKRTANQALGLLRSMFNWAAKGKPQLFAGPNPAAELEQFQEVSRERFLRSDELAPFFKSLAQEPSLAMRDFILLALLTGARRQNVAAMAWADVNLERAEWAVAGELMKNGEPQTITLVPQAVDILRNRKAERDLASRAGSRRTDREKLCAQFVFPSLKSESGHIEDPRKAWQRTLRNSKLTNMTIHDLRRTLGSWQARTGASLVLIGKSLNHKSHDATAIYARLDLDPVRQSVERATAAMFEAAGIKTPAAVVPLQTGATNEALPKRGQRHNG